MLETWVRIPCEAGVQFKKSQTVVSTAERHFTLSVVCLRVECTKDIVRVTKKNIQIVVGRLGWKWIEKSVLHATNTSETKRSRTIIIIVIIIYKYSLPEKTLNSECKLSPCSSKPVDLL